jgi:GTP cyclohydrolase I/GTP cyclohydrolase-4
MPTQEIYTLHTSAVAAEHGTRRIVGVSAQGTTTSPITQALVAAAAGERLAAEGFAEDRIERILTAVPVAAAGDRGFGTLHIGCPEGSEADLDAAALLAIVEGAMSSEIYELLKRSDEGAIVERAHRNPRFPEDCVRGMLGAVLERYAHLPDDAFVSARQENLATLHQHDVVVERHGLLGEVRRDVAGAAPSRHTSAREWLDAAP